MFRGFFGRVKNKAETQPPAPQPGDVPGAQQVSKWPWDGLPDSKACNYAVGHLYHNLPARLTANGGVHAETCLTAIGAIAGFAAQRALFAHLRETKNEAVIKQMRLVKTPTGGEYYFGEPLNRMLVPASDAENNQRLWALAAGGAVSDGLSPAQLPKLADMFAHVAKHVGGEEEGLPSVPKNHHPHKRTAELLKHVWPLALMCFTGRFPNMPQNFGAASHHHWPVIASRVASALIPKMPTSLDRRVALILVMEAAIYGSKLHPSALSDGAGRDGKTLH